MIKIAHRGNTNGPNPEKENSPSYILGAIDKGFDCEIDLWKTDEGLFLGHDGPEYEIGETFLFDFSSKLWIHCKNLEALGLVVNAKNRLNGFWHQEDNYTLTTKGFIWTYPNRPTMEGCVLVHLSLWKESDIQESISGICSDFFTDNFIL